MIVDDRRTEEVLSTPHVIVMMTDRTLSGWGRAGNSPSYAGWACKPEDQYMVKAEVQSRGDAKNVRIVGPDYRAPRGPGHVSIYVHKSLKGGE